MLTFNARAMFMIGLMYIVYIVNRFGPNTELGDTSTDDVTLSDFTSPSLTRLCRWLRYKVNYLLATPRIPSVPDIRDRRALWLIMSKAADISNGIREVVCNLSISSKTSFTILTGVISAERLGPYVD